MDKFPLPKCDSSEQIRLIFDEIADRYDMANAALSLGMHYSWNRALCSEISSSNPKYLLDLCAGTGAIGLQLSKSCIGLKEIFLVDLSEKMLNIAQKRHERDEPNSEIKIHFTVADALDLPDRFKNGKFDVTSMAYGLRNLTSAQKAFEEAWLTLRPGGTFAILELTRPSMGWLRWLHHCYLHILPYVGLLLTRRLKGYRHLKQSVADFASVQTLKGLAERARFTDVRCHPLHFGIASLIICKKGL